MYGVADNIDLKEIIGTYLSQVCLGKFDVQFRFSDGTIIAAQCPVSIIRLGDVIAEFKEDGSWTSMEFRNLLNLEVKNWSVPCDRVLQIEFEEDYILQLTDDSDQYESFQIFHRGSISEMTIV
jgi:hypothetical protein